jgi:hypothetical protein
LQGKLLNSTRLLCSLLLVLMAPVGLVADQEFAHRDHHFEFATDPDGQFPLTYIYGSVVEENLIHDGKGKYATNITFQPRYASELFTQSVLFCGNRADAFNAVDGPIVVTYGRVADKLVKAVPCFDLLSVDRVQSKEVGALTIP